MRLITTILFLLLYTVSSAQSLISKSIFDLGTIEYRNDDVIDLQIYNSIKDTLYLLRTESNGNASFKFTNKNLKPGYVATFRIKLNPKQKGRITETVQFFFSNHAKPVEITIKAKVKNIEKNGLQDCPSFSNYKTPVNSNGVYNPVGQISAYRVVLSESNEDIEQLTEKVQKELVVENMDTVPLVQTSTARQARLPKTKSVNDNRRNNPSIGQILFGKSDLADTSKIEVPETITTPVKNIETIVQEKIDPNVLNNAYKPNNVVFLIDASSSMRENDKMVLLKKSMIELLELLRPVDYLSIVTYSGDAKVILPPTSAINKEEIIKIIERIKADGSTQAVKGIKKAIQIAKSNFLSDGNNQILLASDGAFDIGERNKSLRKKISSEAKKGLKVSVLGIKNERWTNKSLKEICELGNGELIRINKEGDTKKVLEEVKKQSIK